MGVFSYGSKLKSGFGEAYNFIKSTLGSSDSHVAASAAHNFIGALPKGQSRTLNAVQAAAAKESGVFLNPGTLAKARAGYNDAMNFIGPMGRFESRGLNAMRAGIDSIGLSDLNSSTFKRMGIYGGIGAAAGAGRSYYNDDNFGGYVRNMIGGAALGGGAGAARSSYLTEGTYLNSMKGQWKNSWNSFRGPLK